jgi:hypothetical protein
VVRQPGDRSPASLEQVRSLTPGLALAAVLLSGCAGNTCDDLPALRAERDQARADYLELVQSGQASPEETGDADDELHRVERQVFDLEQSCES